jgi:8-amino-7-oxononanoate synthase
MSQLQEQRLQASLAQRKADGLYRQRHCLDGGHSIYPRHKDGAWLSFSSNDYLGLAADPRIAEAWCQGAHLYGVGSGAAHLITGHRRSHHELEQALADWLGYPRALLFSTGYMANLGVLTALVQPKHWIYADRLNHASLVDGARLSNARLWRYPHIQTDLLQARLNRQPAQLIVTDGVFSMDGDQAPLPTLAAIAAQHDAWLVVDDAHGFGTFGADGRGLLARYHLTPNEVPIVIGTFGKAFGTFGAFVAASDCVIETLIQQARSYIYTTAVPPALAHATLTALHIVQQESWRRDQLATHIAFFTAAMRQFDLPLLPSETAIQPILAGTSQRAMAWSEQLMQQGILVSAVRPPTVPQGSARLRITLSAAHTQSDLERLITALAQLDDRD